MQKRIGGTAERGRGSIGLIPITVVLAAAILPFLPTLGNHFVYDDITYIVRNPVLTGSGTVGDVFFNSFPPNSRSQGLYRPLVTLSFLVDHLFFGMNPFGYHLQNIFWHGLATLLVFFLLRRFTSSISGALFGSLLFALHPIHTEAVSWAVGRAELMAAFFSLSAFYLLAGRRGWGIGPAVLFFFGLLSKENAVVLPLLLVLFDRLFAGSRNSLWKKYIPLSLLFGFFLLLRCISLNGWPGPRGEHQIFAGQGILAALNYLPLILVTYLQLLFFPLNLSVVRYDLPGEWTLLWGRGLLYLVFLAALLFFAVRGRRRSSCFSPAVGWFFLSLVPFLNIVPIGEVIAERFLYLPSVGWSILIAGFFRNGRGWKYTDGRFYSGKYFSLLFALLLCLLFLILTVQRNSDWRDSASLWKDAISKSPRSPYAHFGYGFALLTQGIRAGETGQVRLLNEAADRFQRVLALDPTFPKAEQVYYNLGYIFGLFQGRSEQSAAFFRKSLEVKPAYVEAMMNLIALFPKGGVSVDEALALCRSGLQVCQDPGKREFFHKKEKEIRAALQKKSGH